MIAAVVLAAGSGTRFGGDKLLATLHGRPIVRWSAGSIAGAVDDVVVVVPDGDTRIRASLQGISVRFVENARRAEGMSSSLAAGVASLGAECEAVLVALADQPDVCMPVVQKIIQRWRETRAPAVVPMYADGRGHPVLFDRQCFAALVALRGDVGARAVLASLGDAVAKVRVANARPADVDTVDALEALERSPRPGT